MEMRQKSGINLVLLPVTRTLAKSLICVDDHDI
jgi:hypothetical protein